MYQKSFYITPPVGNNTFSFNERKTKQLFVPSLKKISSLDEIQLTREITFEDYDFDGVLQTCHGLENLYELQYPLLTSPSKGQEQKGAPLYLVDNHNHVLYFWYLTRSQGIISDNSLLYHIDEHADTRDPWEYLLKPESEDLQKVFEYTNFFLNVGNYIIPAQKEWLVWEVVQIRSESALGSYERGEYIWKEKGKSIILNLDLDFFSPGLDYIDYELKKRVILDIAKKADLITVCTSPFFIDQERALGVFRDLFS